MRSVIDAVDSPLSSSIGNESAPKIITNNTINLFF